MREKREEVLFVLSCSPETSNVYYLMSHSNTDNGDKGLIFQIIFPFLYNCKISHISFQYTILESMLKAAWKATNMSEIGLLTVTHMGNKDWFQ